MGSFFRGHGRRFAPPRTNPLENDLIDVHAPLQPTAASRAERTTEALKKIAMTPPVGMDPETWSKSVQKRLAGIAANHAEQHINTDFVRDFTKWVTGRPRVPHRGKSVWHEGGAVHGSEEISFMGFPGVRRFVASRAEKRAKFEAMLERLKKGPVFLYGSIDLLSLYVYFKYIVDAPSSGLPDDWLSDFKLLYEGFDPTDPLHAALQDQGIYEQQVAEIGPQASAHHYNNNSRTAPEYGVRGGTTGLRNRQFITNAGVAYRKPLYEAEGVNTARVQYDDMQTGVAREYILGQTPNRWQRADDTEEIVGNNMTNDNFGVRGPSMGLNRLFADEDVGADDDDARRSRGAPASSLGTSVSDDAVSLGPPSDGGDSASNTSFDPDSSVAPSRGSSTPSNMTFDTDGSSSTRPMDRFSGSTQPL